LRTATWRQLQIKRTENNRTPIDHTVSAHERAQISQFVWNVFESALMEISFG